MVNHRNGHTGQLASVTTLLNFFGATVRILTTIQEVGWEREGHARLVCRSYADAQETLIIVERAGEQGIVGLRLSFFIALCNLSLDTSRWMSICWQASIDSSAVRQQHRCLARPFRAFLSNRRRENTLNNSRIPEHKRP